MPARILPIQQLLATPLPTIEGNVDYERLRAQLIRIDQLLIQSGLEEQFVAATLESRIASSPSQKVSANAVRLLPQEDRLWEHAFPQVGRQPQPPIFRGQWN